MFQTRRVPGHYTRPCGEHPTEPVAAYLRTFRTFRTRPDGAISLGADFSEDHLVPVCRRRYHEIHGHPDCSGHEGGCFDALDYNVPLMQEYERDVCQAIPFEAAWSQRQQERFNLLHSHARQVAWRERREAR
jgi:hypothetical protein